MILIQRSGYALVVDTAIGRIGKNKIPLAIIV